MKKLYFLSILFLALSSCNSYKKAQKNIYSGNFDQALDGMITKYKKDHISEKDASRWAGIFNEAYLKAKNQNLDAIQRAQLMIQSSEKHRIILDNYSAMQARIDKLKPYMPIKVRGQEVVVDYNTYYQEIVQSKLELSNALYVEAEELMKTNDKMAYRLAYDKYSEIAVLTPSYTSIQSRINESYQRGLNHILVTINNDSRSLLPRRLHQDITNFNAYGVQNFWNILHTQPENIAYDYYVELNFRDIRVMPERIDKNTFTVTKELESKDTSRNAPKKTISCKVVETRLFKDASIQSEILLFDQNKQLVHRQSPIQSSFIFDYKWAEYYGDKNAIDSKYLKDMKCSAVLIPSHEQMLYDCAQDLKGKLKCFIQKNVYNI